MASAVYEEYKRIMHWRPQPEKQSLSQIRALHALPLFSQALEHTLQNYKRFHRRKDGTSALSHPLAVVCNLQNAGITDDVTLCAGLMHDLVEDLVDEYRDTQDIAEDDNGIRMLDAYEEELFVQMQQDFEQKKIDRAKSAELIDILRLLTRHKRHIYYRSIIGIFCCKNASIKQKALIVKLADRTHNIQCMKTYTERQSIYQCFKNLFILNNAKVYFQATKPHPAFEKLFEKCSKATYDALLAICRQTLRYGIGPVESLLQLAFRKFLHERNGLDGVTEPDKRELHPLSRYHGIILKYDSRLHHEYDTYDSINAREKEYYKKLFADFKFKAAQLQAIVDYKDAYALKEAISYLLYKKKYIVEGFAGDTLCRD